MTVWDYANYASPGGLLTWGAERWTRKPKEQPAREPGGRMDQGAQRWANPGMSPQGQQGRLLAQGEAPRTMEYVERKPLQERQPRTMVSADSPPHQGGLLEYFRRRHLPDRQTLARASHIGVRG